MQILGVSLGHELSASVRWDARHQCLLELGMEVNEGLLRRLGQPELYIISGAPYVNYLAVGPMPGEMLMVGEEAVNTKFFAGQLAGLWAGRQYLLVTHEETCRCLCHSPQATDAAIIKAVMDRFGGEQRIIRDKAASGSLYRVGREVWMSLAIAVAAEAILNKARRKKAARLLNTCTERAKEIGLLQSHGLARCDCPPAAKDGLEGFCAEGLYPFYRYCEEPEYRVFLGGADEAAYRYDERLGASNRIEAGVFFRHFRIDRAAEGGPESTVLGSEEKSRRDKGWQGW